jgi:phosphate starvation-inducible PhoH-like protein
LALEALNAGTISRIVLTRPAVEAGENLGFLPGNISEKIDPYLRPFYDAIFDLMDRERAMRCSANAHRSPPGSEAQFSNL